jgi:hypothetical protein
MADLEAEIEKMVLEQWQMLEDEEKNTKKNRGVRRKKEKQVSEDEYSGDYSEEDQVCADNIIPSSRPKRVRKSGKNIRPRKEKSGRKRVRVEKSSRSETGADCDVPDGCMVITACVLSLVGEEGQCEDTSTQEDRYADVSVPGIRFRRVRLGPDKKSAQACGLATGSTIEAWVRLPSLSPFIQWTMCLHLTKRVQVGPFLSSVKSLFCLSFAGDKSVPRNNESKFNENEAPVTRDVMKHMLIVRAAFTNNTNFSPSSPWTKSLLRLFPTGDEKLTVSVFKHFAYNYDSAYVINTMLSGLFCDPAYYMLRVFYPFRMLVGLSVSECSKLYATIMSYPYLACIPFVLEGIQDRNLADIYTSEAARKSIEWIVQATNWIPPSLAPDMTVQDVCDMADVIVSISSARRFKSDMYTYETTRSSDNVELATGQDADAPVFSPYSRLVDILCKLHPNMFKTIKYLAWNRYEVSRITRKFDTETGESTENVETGVEWRVEEKKAVHVITTETKNEEDLAAAVSTLVSVSMNTFVDESSVSSALHDQCDLLTLSTISAVISRPLSIATCPTDTLQIAKHMFVYIQALAKEAVSSPQSALLVVHIPHSYPELSEALRYLLTETCGEDTDTSVATLEQRSALVKNADAERRGEAYLRHNPLLPVPLFNGWRIREWGTGKPSPLCPPTSAYSKLYTVVVGAELMPVSMILSISRSVLADTHNRKLLLIGDHIVQNRIGGLWFPALARLSYSEKLHIVSNRFPMFSSLLCANGTDDEELERMDKLFSVVASRTSASERGQNAHIIVTREIVSTRDGVTRPIMVGINMTPDIKHMMNVFVSEGDDRVFSFTVRHKTEVPGDVRKRVVHELRMNAIKKKKPWSIVCMETGPWMKEAGGIKWTRGGNNVVTVGDTIQVYGSRLAVVVEIKLFKNEVAPGKGLTLPVVIDSCASVGIGEKVQTVDMMARGMESDSVYTRVIAEVVFENGDTKDLLLYSSSPIVAHISLDEKSRYVHGLAPDKSEKPVAWRNVSVTNLTYYPLYAHNKLAHIVLDVYRPEENNPDKPYPYAMQFVWNGIAMSERCLVIHRGNWTDSMAHVSCIGINTVFSVNYKTFSLRNVQNPAASETHFISQ